MAAAQFFGYEDLTVGSTAVGLTASTYSNARLATIKVEGGAIRFRLDAGAPTTTVGEAAEIGNRIVLEGSDEVARFRAIRRDGTSAILRVQYAV